jgi:hypothetical protein
MMMMMMDVDTQLAKDCVYCVIYIIYLKFYLFVSCCLVVIIIINFVLRINVDCTYVSFGLSSIS